MEAFNDEIGFMSKYFRKLGGLGMAVNGSKFFKHDKPPSSEQPRKLETVDI